MSQQVNREQLQHVQRWVVKIGSAMLVGDNGLNHDALDSWAKQIADLQNNGKQMVVVTSGAIALGMRALGWKTRPKELPELQSAAAVGQMDLAQAWREALLKYGVKSAQVLLTHDDASDRQRYLNVRATLQTLCQHQIVPIINENDTVSFDEIKFGDNDNLGALVANVTGAGAYIILTDQEGLYTKNPREFADAELVTHTDADNPELAGMAGKTGGILGSGGMYTKILAVQKAGRSGTHTLIAYGKTPNVIARLTAGEALGTFFIARQTPQHARKQWLGSQLQTAGKVYLDAGAVEALLHHHKSLLPVGITKIQGEFGRGELIACLNEKGEEIARGLSNYESEQLQQFRGRHSSELSGLLIHGETAIHKDNLVIL